MMITYIIADVCNPKNGLFCPFRENKREVRMWLKRKIIYPKISSPVIEEKQVLCAKVRGHPYRYYAGYVTSTF